MMFAHDFQIILKLELSIRTLDFAWVDFYIEFYQSLQNYLQKFNIIKYDWIT